MKLPRRRFLQLAAGTAAFAAVSRIARAQSYPTKPVRLIVGFSAGSASDITARLISQWLSDHLGQQFVVENRPGAGSNIATEGVVKASPDGHTLLLTTSANAINATLYEKLSFDFVGDVMPVASIIRFPNVIVVNPTFLAKTISEFIDYAKANPGKINMASAGNGTPPHVAGELFKMMAGVDMVHVPYRGGPPALTDLLAGQVQVYFPPTGSAMEYIRSGKLRALAVTTTSRQEALPDVPTVDSVVPGYEASTWFGIGAPKNTPVEFVEKLNKEINAALADSKINTQLANLGGTVLPGSPTAFGKLIADETEKWGKVVKFSGAKPD